MTIYQIVFRSLLAVLIGGLIGAERGRHGRAAEMRTHIIVSLGSAMTSMTGIHLETITDGDPFRISAQVISGIGFLGAGMIILKNGNVVMWLTTAAGVWTTATIGIAIGYGFYSGAITVALFFFISIIMFAKLERSKQNTEIIYVELNDMYKANTFIKNFQQLFKLEFTYCIMPPKSKFQGNIGINFIIDKQQHIDLQALCNLQNVIYAVED